MITTLPPATGANALRAALTGENTADIAALLRNQGDALLAAGHPRLVAEAARLIPAAEREPCHQDVLGLALVILGDSEGAESALQDRGGPLSVSRAWRLAMLRHLQGEPAAALEAIGRAVANGSGGVDEVQLLNWSSSAAWMLGDQAECARLAEQARTVAAACGQDRAVAAAHSALALSAALSGDRRRNAWHWHRALEAAQRADDVLQEVRIRANLGSHLLEEGRYERAATELAQAAALARRVGFAAFEGLSSCNLGECFHYLGRLDEALQAFEAAASAWQRAGSRMISYSLCGLGDTYRERGDLVLAKAAYDEAIATSGEGHPQAFVPAMDGLARVLSPDDPEAAWSAALAAEKAARDLERPRVRLTLGWLRLVSGCREEADRLGQLVADEAMRRRDRRALAESLELQAMCGAGDSRLRRLGEAGAIWREIGHQQGLRGVTYATERLSDATVSDSRRDSRRPHAAGLMAAVDLLAGPRVEVRVLGRFEVLRDGRAVGEGEWQSRKARELIRLLVARRGRPISREALTELLWPDEDPAQLGNRLSVSLAVVRRIFDPGRAHSPGHFLRTEDGTIALDPTHVNVDVEAFLRDASAGLARRTLDAVDAHRQLRLALDRVSGEVFEEDSYADWAIPLREHVRALTGAAARALAEFILADDPVEAVHYALRALEQDEYDEPAHLLLMRALNVGGRFGEARRAHRRYASRMAELGLDPRPFPRPRPRLAGAAGCAIAEVGALP